MSSLKRGLAWLLLVVLGGTACIGGTAPVSSTGSSGAVQNVRTPVMPDVRGFPSLQEVMRISAAAGDEFLIQQDGAGFAADLPRAAVPNGA